MQASVLNFSLHHNARFHGRYLVFYCQYFGDRLRLDNCYLLGQHDGVDDVDHAVVGNDVDSRDVGSIHFDTARGAYGQ